VKYLTFPEMKGDNAATHMEAFYFTVYRPSLPKFIDERIRRREE